MGFDGLELACWGDHFDVNSAAESKDYCKERWQILTGNGLTAFSISSHLVGQAICDRIDERHKAILPPEVWGDGDPEGVRQRAAERLKLSAPPRRHFLYPKPHHDMEFSPGGPRFHRLKHLARLLRVPTHQSGLLAKRLRRFRAPLPPHPRSL